MTDWKCPFCGSSEIKVMRKSSTGQPYVELGRSGEYEPIYDFCCLSQKRNAEYTQAHYKPGEEPSPDEISKL